MPANQLPVGYTTAQARAAGMTRAQLRDDGQRVTRGGYVSRAQALTVHAACTAVLPLLPDGAVVSHLTAAALLGAPVPHRLPLSFTVPPGVYRPRRRGTCIRVRTLEPADTVVHRGLPVTSAAQTWLDLAASLPPGDLVAVGDALWRAGHLDDAVLGARLDRADGVRGIVPARLWAPRLTPQAASRPESLVRVILIQGDVPDPEVQVPVHDARGMEVAHADVGYSRWRIAGEYEGRQHAELRQFRKDLTRYTLMGADNWLLLRFGDAHLARPAWIVEMFARALRARGATW